MQEKTQRANLLSTKEKKTMRDIGETLWETIIGLHELRKKNPQAVITSTEEAAKTLQRIRERDRVEPCPCECNRGEFCGGCGHRGCGRRR